MTDHFDQPGAREYVGGDFENIGAWQLGFIQHTPEFSARKKFLDLACGNFRLGKHLIPQLNKGRYVGFDSDQRIVDAGLQYELCEAAHKKNPHICVNTDFEFDFDGVQYVWSNSLFSHLTSHDIQKCMHNLVSATTSDAVFYFTFFEGSRRINPDVSDARKDFYYTAQQIITIALAAGWNCEPAEINGHPHPRKQTIMRATKI